MTPVDPITGSLFHPDRMKIDLHHNQWRGLIWGLSEGTGDCTGEGGTIFNPSFNLQSKAFGVRTEVLMDRRKDRKWCSHTSCMEAWVSEMLRLDVSVETPWGADYIKIDKELRLFDQLDGYNISRMANSKQIPKKLSGLRRYPLLIRKIMSFHVQKSVTSSFFSNE